MKIIDAIKNTDDHNILMEAAMNGTISAIQAKMKKIGYSSTLLDVYFDLAFIAIQNINRHIKQSCSLNDKLIVFISNELSLPTVNYDNCTIYFAFNSNTNKYDGYLLTNDRFEKACEDVDDPEATGRYIKFKTIGFNEMPITWVETIQFIYRKYNVPLPETNHDYLQDKVVYPVAKILKRYYKDLGYKVKLRKHSRIEIDDIAPWMIISWK